MEVAHLWNNGELTLESPETKEGEEPFVEIQIVTLKAHLSSLAVDRALERGATLANLSNKVDSILGTELNSAKEFIDVTLERIRVGINCDVIDNDVIANVWEILSRQHDLSPGTKIELGQLVQVYENKNSHLERTS
ncbi:MAG: hypothetical protein KGI25_09580 [Thaumarchaeota archaeon]|nr:hypothetical protein [Nitrososphaerota archaeon]